MASNVAEQPNRMQNQNQNQNRDNQEQEQEDQNQPSFLKRMFYMFLVFQVISFFINKFGPKNKNIAHFKSALPVNATFDVKFYLSEQDQLGRYHLSKLKPKAVVENLTYDSEGVITMNTTRQVEMNYTTNFTKKSEKQHSLYMYSMIVFKDKSLQQELFNSFSNDIYVDKVNLVEFSEDFYSRLMGSMNADLETHESTSVEAPKKTDTSKLNYCPEIVLYLNTYEEEQPITNFEELRVLKIPFHFSKNGNFAPNSYLNKFWCMNREMKPVLNGDNELSVSVEFRFISNFRYKYLRSFENNFILMEESFGLSGQKDVFIELVKFNSEGYLAILAIVNILHTVFSVLGFAGEISYYKNLTNLDGAYSKRIYFDFLIMLVSILYVIDQEINKMVLIELVIGFCIHFWKFKKIFTISFTNRFPFVIFEYKIGFKFKRSERFENDAIRLMVKFLIPVVLGYIFYKFYYFTGDTTYYRLVLSCIFFVIRLYGLVFMFPQVYLNYKLKSVENMPFRAMMYKFLNTIIDDLFAFATNSSTLYKMMTFTDDVIFVVFIYQKIAYRNNQRILTTEKADNEKYLEMTGRKMVIKENCKEIIEKSFGKMEVGGQTFTETCDAVIILKNGSFEVLLESVTQSQFSQNKESIDSIYQLKEKTASLLSFAETDYKLEKELDDGILWQYQETIAKEKGLLILVVSDIFVLCKFDLAKQMKNDENAKKEQNLDFLTGQMYGLTDALVDIVEIKDLRVKKD